MKSNKLSNFPVPVTQGTPGADGPPGRDGATGVKVSNIIITLKSKTSSTICFWFAATLGFS